MTAIAKLSDVPGLLSKNLSLDPNARFFVEVDLAGCSLTFRQIDPEQAWFWAPEWQSGEREADADLAEGRYERFMSDKDFLDSFE